MYYFVKGRLARHLYVIFFGVLIQLYMFGSEILHNVILSYGAFALMGLFPKDKQQHVVTIFVFGYLTYIHFLCITSAHLVYNMGIITYTMLHVLKL